MTDHEDIRKALKAATPGPWDAHDLIAFRDWTVQWQGEDIATVYGTERSPAYENAHLIANAPQWLAALLEENRELSEWKRTREAVDVSFRENQRNQEQAVREAIARAEAAEKERDEALSGEADAVRRAESAELGCEIAYRREPTQAEGDAHEADHGCDCCDDDCQRCAHLSPQGIKSGECFVAMGGWTGRRCRVCRRWVWGGPTACVACVAAEERAALLAENARLRAESKRIGWGVVANAGRLSSKYAPRWAYVCEAVGIGSTSAKDLCREHGFDPDESVGPPLGAHASQPQCPSCHGTRTVMDADHDSRVLTADDCPACSQPKGDGGYDA